MAEAFWLADTRADGAMSAFLAWRCSVVTSLVAEIRAAVRKDATVAVIPSVARPTAGAWYEGSDLAALAQAAGVLEACLYESGAARVKADLFDVKRRLRGEGRLRAILRPAFPDLESEGDFLTAMRALRDAGVDEVAFYNWGHIRDSNLDWIRDGLAVLGGQA
jgi:imidazole glycerol phosphate synthase subunit HisF